MFEQENEIRRMLEEKDEEEFGYDCGFDYSNLKEHTAHIFQVVLGQTKYLDVKGFRRFR